MKNITGLYLAVFTLIAVSCGKRSTDLPQPDVKSNIKSSAKSIRIVISLRPIWHDEGGSNYGCDGIGGNCLPEVVIVCTPLKQTMQAVDNYDPNGVVTIFENNRQEMIDVLASEDAVNGVINRELSLSIRGEVNAPVRYLLFTDNSDGQIVEAVPVKSN